LTHVSNISEDTFDSETQSYLVACVDLIFHLRHDIFGMFCQISENGSAMIDTDVNLKEVFGIDTNKTPDWFVKIGDRTIFYEFTVVSDKDKALLQKGGLDVRKYDRESELLTSIGIENEFKLAFYDINDKSTNMFIAEDLNDSFNDYKKFCEKTKELNYLRGYGKDNHLLPSWMIDEFSILTNDVLNSCDFLQLGDISMVPLMTKTFMVPKNFKSRFLKQESRLLKDLSDTNKAFRAVLNYDGNFIQIAYRNDGCRINDLILAIKHFDWKILIKYLYTAFMRGNRRLFEKYKFSPYDDEIIETQEQNIPHSQSQIPYEQHSLEWEVEAQLSDRYLKFYSRTPLPIANDIKKLRNDVKEEVKAMLKNNTDALLINKNVNQDMIVNSIELFKQSISIQNMKEVKDDWISPITTFPLIDPAVVEFGELDVLKFKLNLNRECPIIMAVFKSIQNKTFRTGIIQTDTNLQEKEQLHAVNQKILNLKKTYLLTKENYRDDPNCKLLNTEKKSILNKIKKTKVPYKQTSRVKYITVSKETWKNSSDSEYFNWAKKDDAFKLKKFDGNYGVMKNSNNFMSKLIDFFTGETDYVSRYRGFFDLKLNDKDIFDGLCLEMLKQYIPLFDHIKNKRIMQIADFISKLCFNLTYMSQTAHSGSDFMFENLSCSNVLLIVRGGKKMFTTGRSRHFRLMFPRSDILVDLLTLGRDTHSYIHTDTHILTPWMTLHENEIHQGLTLYQAFTSHYCITQNRLNKDHESNSEILSLFPMILSLHGRRETEASLHSIRYILANMLADSSSVDAMLPELTIKTKDHFQFSLNEGLQANVEKYYLDTRSGNFNNVQHPYLNISFHGETALSTIIYSTYLMTKSPTTQRLEQVKNLKKDLQSHKIFMQILNEEEFYEKSYVKWQDRKLIKYNESKQLLVQKAKNLRNQYKKWKSDRTNSNKSKEEMAKIEKELDFISRVILKTNREEKKSRLYYNITEKDNRKLPHYDFTHCQKFDYSNGYTQDKGDRYAYSSKMSYLVGKSLSDYMKSKRYMPELFTDWDNCLNSSWINVANESGMRYKGKEFFGRKGHYVVTEELLKVFDNDYKKQFLQLLEKDDFTNLKNFAGMDITFQSRIMNMKRPTLIFHIVDKSQRGGGREIYVMDLDTKTLQQPLESFFSKWCKKVPNEVISVPSNKRLAVIHSLLFERAQDENKSWSFATLDCTKWAPASNMNKYILFILGAAECLPSSFVKYFLGFCNLYYNKQVHTSIATFRGINNDQKNQDVSKYFFEDSENNSMFHVKPYSFMMGIFNFLSSLMHAANITFANELINELLLEEEMEPSFKCSIVAHSDDSGGKFEASNNKVLNKGISYYEVMLKMCNHNLSLKKCNLSRKYFEFLSILYINKRLLPLISKTIANLQLEPTDKGPPQELIDCISKSIEIVSIGGTFSEAYFKKILKADSVCDFYKIPKDINLPPQALGYPCSHPLLDLLAGSNSDLIRLYRKDPTSLMNLLSMMKLTSLEMSEQGIPCLYYRLHIREQNFIKKQRTKLHYSLSEINTKLEGLLDVNEFYSDLSQTTAKHSFLSFLKYYKLYQSKTYTSSLQYENKTRRLGRSMFSVSQKCMYFLNDFWKPRDLQVLLRKNMIAFNNDTLIMEDDSITQLSNDDKLFVEKIKVKMNTIFELSFSELLNFCKRFNHCSLENMKLEKKSLTSKPVNLFFQNNKSGMVLNHNPADILYFHKYKTLSFLILPKVNLASDYERLLDIYPGIDSDNLKMVSSKYQKFNNKEFNIYSQVESEHRHVDNPYKYLSYILENSFYHEKIFNITYQSYKLLKQDNKFSEEMNPQIKMLEIIKTHLIFQNVLYDTDVKFPELQIANKRYKMTDILTKRDTTLSLGLVNLFVRSHIMFKELSELSFVSSDKLLEIPVLYTWLKAQAQLGDSWVGSQVVLIKIKQLALIITLDKETVENVRYYGDFTGNFDIEMKEVWNMLTRKFGATMNFTLTPNDKKLTLGYNKFTENLGVFEGREVSMGCKMENMGSLDDLANQILSGKLRLREKKDNIFYYQISHRNKTLKLYDPIELFNSSSNLEAVVDMRRADSNLWDNFFSKLVRHGIVETKISMEDCLSRFDQFELCEVTDQTNDNLKDMHLPSILELEDDDYQNSCLQEAFKKSLNNISDTQFKSIGKLDNKLKRFFNEMNVDPRTVPESVRKTYTEDIYSKYIKKNMSEYMNDLESLTKVGFEEDNVRYFTDKWGSESFRDALVFFSKSMQSIRDLDEVFDKSNQDTLKLCFYEIMNSVCLVLKENQDIWNKNKKSWIISGNNFIDWFFSLLYMSKKSKSLKGERNFPSFIINQCIDIVFTNDKLLEQMTERVKNTNNKKLKPIFDSIPWDQRTIVPLKSLYASWRRLDWVFISHKTLYEGITDNTRNKLPKDLISFPFSNMVVRNTNPQTFGTLLPAVLDLKIEDVTERFEELVDDFDCEMGFATFDEQFEDILYTSPVEDEDQYEDWQSMMYDKKDNIYDSNFDIVKSFNPNVFKPFNKTGKLAYLTSETMSVDLLANIIFDSKCEVMIIETTSILNLDKWFSTGRMKMYYKTIGHKRNTLCDKFMYVIGNTETLEKIDMCKICNVQSFDKRHMQDLHDDNDFKIINGKRVDLNIFDFKKHLIAIRTLKAMRKNDQDYDNTQVLLSKGLDNLDSLELNQLIDSLNKTLNLSSLYQILENDHNIEKNIIKMIDENVKSENYFFDNGKILYKILNNKKYEGLNWLDVFSKLIGNKSNLMELVSRAGIGKSLIETVNDKDLKNYPTHLFVGKQQFSKFDINSKIKKELDFLLKNKTSEINNNELLLTDIEYNTLKSTICTIENWFDRLVEKDDEKFLNNDGYLLSTLKCLLSISKKTDHQIINHDFLNLIQTINNDYNISRSEYYEKKYKTKKRIKLVRNKQEHIPSELKDKLNKFRYQID
jgi:hypothetical protein